MRKFYCLSTLVLILLCCTQTLRSQDFSNKGKEFWLAYSYHVGMSGGGQPTMTLYLSSDQATTYNVEIYGVTSIAAGSIPANGMISVVIPNTYFVNGNGIYSERAIRVTAPKPIVVYSFITRSQASAATLCLPVNVLGKEYVTSSFTQVSNEQNSNSYITIVAVENNTRVDITPSVATAGGWAAGSLNSIFLQKGEVYQVLGETNGNSGGDLSGTLIKSVAVGTGGCKRIAVFSGSGKLYIQAPFCSNQSSDNLYQQLYPVSTWGRKYLTVPSVNKPNNYYRIYRSDPATNVYLNGALVPGGAFTNNYYQFFNNTPNIIEADIPVSVAQYFTTQGCPGNPSPYDPDMIMLNPVEQNISKVTLVNSPLTVAGTHQHNLHVVMRNSGTAQSSFTLDGTPVPVGSWVPHPGDGNYSYLYLPSIASGNHTLYSDSGFNAVAYGYGNAETYGYSAGTNVKDIYQQIGVSTQYGVEPTPSVCVGAPFKFKVSLPYQADSLYWDLSALPGPPANVMVRYPPAAPDSTTVVNGKTIYWYSLPATYTMNVTGTFPVTITSYAPNTDGCGNVQEIVFDLEVSQPPVAGFSFVPPACVAVPVQFTETTPQTPKPTYAFWWDFGDPASGAANNSTLRNPTHLFSAPGTYTVRFADITTPGCLSDTIQQQITVPAMPTATITADATVCVNGTPPVITFTGSGGTGAYEFTYNINGGPNQTITTTSGNSVTLTQSTAAAGTFVYNLVSVRNVSATACTQNQTGSVTINVLANPVINLTSAPNTNAQTVCINTSITNITYSVVGPGAGATITGLPAGVTGSFSGGTVTITGTPTAAGTYNYSVNGTSDCGQISATGTITVSPDATIALTSSPATSSQTVCINTAITNITYSIGGSGTGANISGLPPGVSSSFAGGVFTISGSPTSAGTYNYTVTTTGNCQNNSLSGTITVTPDATLSLTSGAGTASQAVCINTAIANITYAVGGAATGASATGLPAGVTGVYNSGVFTISGTPTTAGVFNYSVAANGNCGANTLTGTITVNPDASISLTSGPSSNVQTVCINTAMTNITYAIGGGGTNASVTGLPAGVSGSFSGGVFTISGSPTATGTFNYTVTTTGTCNQTSASGTITVTPNATLNLTSAPNTNAQTVCINTALVNITYSISGSGTNGNVTGLPAGVTGSFSAGTFTISGTPTAPGVFNYVVNATGSCGQASANGTITVNDDATLTLTSAASTSAQEVCLNAAITNITYAVGGGGTGATVTGLPAGVTGSFSGGVFTISGTPSAAGSYNYTVTTQGPCVQHSLSGTINVNLLPDANFDFTLPGCETQTVTFNDLSVPNTGTIISWTWNFGDPASGGNNTSSLQDPTHIFATPGNYTVTLTVTTDKGCTSTIASQPVTIHPKPESIFTPPTACTSDQTAPFTDGSNNAVAWEWNFGDPNANAGNPNTSTQQNPTHHYTVAGSYTAQLIVTNSQGCKDTTTRTFTVNGSPTAAFTVNNSSGLCSNEEVSITDNSSVDFGSMVKLVIYWDYLNDPTNFVTVNNPTAGTVYNHTYTEFGSPASRSYRIRVEAYSGISCVSVKTEDITLLATPTLQFDPVDAICGDVPAFQVTQASMINGLPGSGSFSGPGITSSGMFNPATAGEGIHTIRYTYTGTNGCSNFIEQTIEVYPVPPTNAGPDKVVLEGGQVTLTPAMNASMPVTYLWTPSTGLNNPTIANPVSSPPFDITYTLTVTTDNGCSKSDQVFVKVLKAPLIPNIFSPNGDGVHDKWEIAFLETYPGCTVDIYNRYGQLIYHSVGYSKPWDGMVNGKPVPVGTYYYIVNPKNGRQQYSGYVDVIR